MRYFETYISDKGVFLVMKYVKGGSRLLDKIKRTKGAMTEYRVCHYMKQIIYALNHCHSLNIVHRDIKPDNIMVSDLDNIKLIDFGLAEIVTEKIKDGAGTWNYMAPEQFDQSFTDKVDIWAAGAIMYLMCTGRVPFPGLDKKLLLKKIKKDPYPSDSKAFQVLSEDCKDVIH